MQSAVTAVSRQLESGNTVIAGRGFDIEDILPSGVTTNLPPFLGRRSQLDSDEVLNTRRIVTVRIHVERAIE